MVIKRQTKPFVRFYQISTDSLVTFSPIRKRIMRNLNIQIDSIQLIDPIYKKIITKIQNRLEIWDLDSEKLENSFLLTNRFDAKYSSGMILLFYQENNELRIELHDHIRNLNFFVSLVGGILPYYCQIINDDLIIGMKNREMIKINYANSEIFCNLGKCIRYYEMEHYNDAFLLKENGRGIFISQPNNIIECGQLSRIFVNIKNKLIAYSKEEKTLKIITTEGIIEKIHSDELKNLNILGANKDSNQLYLGSTLGRILIFE